MSMIEKIQNRQGLLIVMIGLGMLGFLIPYDAVMALFGQGASRDVGQVDGVEISALAYQSELQERRRLGFSGDQLSNEVWADLTSGIVLSDDFDALGLSVSNEEFQEMLFGSGYSPYMNRAFYSNSENKQFWQNNFSSMLNTPRGKADFMSYKRLIVEKRKREKFDNLVNIGIYSNALEGEMDYRNANRKVSFQYALKSFVAIPDSVVSVSDSDVKRYYKAHKDDSEFKQTSGRDVTFTRIPVSASADDALSIEADLNVTRGLWETTADSDSQFVATANGAPFIAQSLKSTDIETDVNEAGFMDASKGDLFGPYQKGQTFRLAKVLGFTSEPDSASCRHILLKATNPGDDAEMAQLMSRADSLKKALNRGSNFEDLVTTFSDDPGSVSKGGFYDFFTRGRMVAAFENFCFENKPGSVGAVKTQFGVHLIEVMEHTNAVKRTNVAIIEKPLVPSEKTIRSAYSAAREFAINTNNRDDFMSSASDTGYPTNIAKDIRRNATSISGLRNAEELIGWSFTAEEGDVSNPFLIDNAYVVGYLDRITTDGVPPFKHVEQAMRVGAIREAKGIMFANQMKSGSLQEIATAVDTKVQSANNIALKFPTVSSAGSLAEPEVVGSAFGIPIGNISQPIVGENGIWVISPTAVTEATEKTDFLTEQTSLLAKARGAVTQRISNAMLEAAGLEDMRNSQQ